MTYFRVLPKQALSMETRDRTRLDADVYYPEGDGLFPVLLMRQPYGRAIASTVVYAHPIWYARHGYIVVIQDVRGRGTSEGTFRLFETEREDGEDAIAWAAQLPQSTGQVGMYGFSYQGMTQLYAAETRPPALRAIAPAMVGYDLYADWAYENGALLLQAGLGWAIQLAAETARRAGDVAQFQQLYAASRALPLNDPIPVRPGIMSDLAADSFWHQWLDHPHPDAYWASFKPDLAAVDLPMLHIGGWFDPYLRGDLRLFQEMQGKTSPQQLWLGPWGHLPWGHTVGARDFGPQANSPIDRVQIRWFDRWLKGKNWGLLQDEPIHLFEMGSNQWRTFDTWPDSQIQSFYLVSSGLAGLQDTDGQLVDEFPNSPPPPDVIVHDPWRPVPALGGHSAIPAGAYDRATLDQRSDILTYTTPPLRDPLTVVGMVQVELRCAVDAPSFDLCAVLSEVCPDGRVWNLTQGYCRVDQTAGEKLPPITVPLQPTCFTVVPGHALRLSLSAACFPAYAVNAGTGQSAGESALVDFRIVTMVINPPQMALSKLKLPLLKAD